MYFKVFGIVLSFKYENITYFLTKLSFKLFPKV